MRGIINYTCEGEILGVQKTADGERNISRYLCRVWLNDGSNIIVNNVVEASLFGGISDYTRRRARASMDDGKKMPGSFDVESLDATIGERVYINFIGGNLARPIIIGYAQHPNQTTELENPSELEPQAIFQYLGIRIEVDELGQLRFIHKGAPTVKYEPRGGVGGALGAVASLAGGVTGDSAIGGNDNPAIKPAPDTDVTLWEMLKDGVFRIRDQEGQIIEIDRTKKRIYISNNDLKSTEDAAGGPASGGNQLASNSTDAEYVLLDKDKELVLINARKTAQIYSFDKRKDVTEGIHSHKVGEDSKWEIGGDEIIKVDGDQKLQVSGDQKEEIGGDQKVKVSGDQKTDVSGDINASSTGGFEFKVGKGWNVKVSTDTKIESSGATLSLGKGKVALGAGPTELVDQIIQILDAFINNAPSLCLTKVGEGVMNPAAVALLTKAKISLMAIKGSI